MAPPDSSPATDSAPSDITGLGTLVIETGELSLRLYTDPFSFELRNTEGQLILHTPHEELLAGYGPPTASATEPSLTADGFTGWLPPQNRDQERVVFDRTISGEMTVNGATIILASSSTEEDALTVELSATGNRMDVTYSLNEAARERLSTLGQSFYINDNEQFFGLGERLSSVNHRGHSYYCWNEEMGLALPEEHLLAPENPSPNGPAMTGFSVPFVLSTSGYGLWLNTHKWSSFHLGSDEPSVWRMEAHDPDLHFTVVVNQQPTNTLYDFTEDSGRLKTPPIWTFGVRHTLAQETEVMGMEEWRLIREMDLPVTLLEDGHQFLPEGVDISVESTLLERNSLLHEWGFRVLSHVSPHISSSSEAISDHFTWTEDQGYLLQAESGETVLIPLVPDEATLYATLDITNPSAIGWFEGILRNTFELGYDGWRINHGALINGDAMFSDGRSGEEMHNIYSETLQGIVADLVEMERPEEATFLGRSGNRNSAAHLPMVWSNATTGTFGPSDGLPAAVRSALNLGLSGFPITATDIGGFRLPEGASIDKNLYVRWVQFSALTAGMQDWTMNTASETGWSLWSDEETLTIYRNMAKLHTQLAPYFHLLARDAEETGLPLIRHLLLHYPQDQEVWSLDDQYLLGSGLLVAPVLLRNAFIRDVYFPEGLFANWYTGEILEGPLWQTVDAPLDIIPLFLTDGAIIPLLNGEVDTLVVEDNPEVVGHSDINDQLLVRSFVSTGEHEIFLEDRTQITVSISGEIAPPFLMQNIEMTHETSLESMEHCDNCYFIDTSTDSTRYYFNALSTELSSITAEGLELSVINPRELHRSVRWELWTTP